jgi:hypothetical protein
MTVATQTATTGDFVLPDPVATVSYNGVTFGPLMKSTCEDSPLPDEAGRTNKYVEIKVSIEGYVTLKSPAATTDPQWATIRNLLTKAGGKLTYKNKGFGALNVNATGGQQDVKWGPVPKLLHFQPLGGSRSAMVKWECTVYVIDLAAQPTFGAGQSQPCQWNFGLILTYDEDGYSHISIKGTLEIPMTRATIGDRSIPDVVDKYRQKWINMQLDRNFFRETDRRFDYSRDKRTCEWSIEGEELPPMPLPVGCNRARGSMTVRNVNIGGTEGGELALADLSRWAVTLRARYAVRADFPRRRAYQDFLQLLWVRFWCAENAQNDVVPPKNPPSLVFDPSQPNAPQAPNVGMSAVLYGFSLDEGLYLDSKEIGFEATWFVPTQWYALIQSIGVWSKGAGQGQTEWKASAGAFFGWRSWLGDFIDPKADIIVDLGGGDPPPTTIPIKANPFPSSVNP